MTRRFPLAAALAGSCAAALIGSAIDAAACGGLVAPNGSVRLARASTMVSWHDGVEHYMTSFAYQGAATDIGWIVPLPAVPDKVEKGGGWTLQRLAREARPQFLHEQAAFGAGAPAVADSAVVLQQVTIDALDVTVLKGSGQAVVDWCATNGFLLPAETRAHILAYAMSSPIFMAAKYNTDAARTRGQFTGDGTPVLITMHTPRLWVPLEVLANQSDPLDADVFLLTDARPAVAAISNIDLTGLEIAGAPGFRIIRQEQVPDQLFRDLSTDRNMGWLAPGGWFTALNLSATGTQVTYDMTMVPTGRLSLAPMGAGPDAVARGVGTPIATAGSGLSVGTGAAIAAVVAGALLLAGAAAFGELRRRRTTPV
jgi:hypothetical protein